LTRKAHKQKHESNANNPVTKTTQSEMYVDPAAQGNGGLCTNMVSINNNRHQGASKSTEDLTLFNGFLGATLERIFLDPT
jgi:hypothetical protein